METKKTLFGIMAAATMLTSCVNDEGNFRAGFGIESPSSNISYYYANNVSDSLIFYGYGNWDLIDLSGYDNSWITVPIRTGKGSVLYSQELGFKQNTTDLSRTAAIQIRDTNHPGEAHISLAFIQYATRGDGSLGSAADVKSITGSDDSNITLEYDTLHRPTLVKIQKAQSPVVQVGRRIPCRVSIRAGVFFFERLIVNVIQLKDNSFKIQDRLLKRQKTDFPQEFPARATPWPVFVLSDLSSFTENMTRAGEGNRQFLRTEKNAEKRLAISPLLAYTPTQKTDF